jgi:hypothetical protein
MSHSVGNEIWALESNTNEVQKRKPRGHEASSGRDGETWREKLGNLIKYFNNHQSTEGFNSLRQSWKFPIERFIKYMRQLFF